MEMVEDLKGHSTAKHPLRPWIICFGASLFFFYEFIQGNMFASIADNIMRDFHIQADKMTYLSSIYYLANVLFLFAAGLLLDKLSAKKTIVFAMVLCVGSTFVFAKAQSFYLALICRFIMGIGSAFCFLGPVRIASRWFPPQKMAMVTGAIVTMAMSGGMLAQYPLTKLVAECGWRDSMTIVGWLGVGMLLFVTFWVEDKPSQPSQTSTKKRSFLHAAKAAYLDTQTVGAAMYTSLMNMAVAVFGAVMGSLYLMQRLEISKEDAALINSLLFLGAIIGGPVIGWCSDKLNVRLWPMRLGAFLSLLTVLAVLYAPVNFTIMSILFFLLGFFTASQVISYALVAESHSPHATATALSVISLLTQGGYIVYQNLFSRLLMHYDPIPLLQNAPSYSLNAYLFAATILPVGLLIALILPFCLQETHCHPLQE